MKPYEPVPYTAEGMVDPFRPDASTSPRRARARRAPPEQAAPDLNRPKEPLEAFPLESIQMLGTITQNRETFALVKAGPNLYRIRKGNYMGLNFGVVTGDRRGADQSEGAGAGRAGEWVERASALQLVEAKK